MHCIAWKPKVRYYVHNSPPPYPIMARWIQPTLSKPTSLRHISILSYHLFLGLPSGPLPSDLSTKAHIHFCLLDLITKSHLVWNDSNAAPHYTILSSLLLLPPPSGPNIFLRDLFLNTRSNLPLMSETEFHAHDTTGNMTVLCIVILTFLDSKPEERWFRINGAGLPWILAYSKESIQFQGHMQHLTVLCSIS
jgi:hypothetical protein